MYDFIFKTFFNLFNKLGTVDPRDNAVSMVVFAFFAHLFFLLNVITVMLEINLLTLAYGENHSKYLWLPVILVIMFLFYKWYNEDRTDKILKGSNMVKGVVSARDVIIVLALIILPFGLGIVLLNSN